MSLSSRFREVYSFTPDSVSSSPVVSGLSDESHGTLTQPIYSPRYSSGSNIVPNAYHYSDITDFVLLVISLVLLIIVLGVYFMKKYYYPPVEMSQVDITPVEITRTEINATRQQAVDRRPRQMSEGLDRKITESFPVVAYSAAQIANNPAECAVCLSEFQEGEKARWLPKCGHVFHLECIDRWLFSHSTCPLCRVSLIPESHAITLESTNSPHASTGLETSNSAVHANGGDVAALSEGTTGLSNNGAERDAEGEALFAPSRSSQPLQHTAQEITIQERLAPTSGRYLLSISVDEGSSTSSSLVRSCSLQESRITTHHKMEAPFACYGQSLNKERSDNAIPIESTGVGVAIDFRKFLVSTLVLVFVAKASPDFYSSKRREW